VRADRTDTQARAHDQPAGWIAVFTIDRRVHD
jgi:hypothetical protein